MSPQPLKIPKIEITSPSPPPKDSVGLKTAKPEYHLVSFRPDGPVYSLVYEGPAPKGWEKAVEWNQNVFLVDGEVSYQNECCYLTNCFKS
uniref:PsbP domain-containing protein n=1 Tax=Caenorhabditis tropicalis TaxID=1561998 RepID=A0A1I7URY9_9PELO